MKSEAIEPDLIKIESRQSIHRRKMSKNSPIVNGADESLSYAVEDESVVRQINLAAAFHDHISCTKSAELCKIDGTREPRVSLPCETDHIYANCSDFKRSPFSSGSGIIPSREFLDENKQLKKVLFVQLELIKQLEEEILVKNRQIKTHKQESAMLRARLDRRDHMCLLRKRICKPDEENTGSYISVAESVPPPEVVNVNNTPAVPVPPVTEAPIATEHPSTIPSVTLATRYFGRRSKTIPSRALKRRYLGPPKTIPAKKPVPKSLSSATSISSASEAQEVIFKPEIPTKVTKPVIPITSLITCNVKKNRKRGKRPKGISQKTDFLTTDKAYYLPDNRTSSPTLCPEATIDVPSWKLKPVTSFYQMEGTENINDPVFHRRHLKCEQDERRRKRWDIQRLREQKASEKLKHKYCRDAGKESGNVQQKSQSFYPDSHHIQYIEVTDQLPVLAFGHPIPLFQPSEFSLPWKIGERKVPKLEVTTPVKVTKKSSLSAASPKVT